MKARNDPKLAAYINYLEEKIARKIARFDKYAHLRQTSRDSPEEEVEESGKKPKRRKRST